MLVEMDGSEGVAEPIVSASNPIKMSETADYGRDLRFMMDPRAVASRVAGRDVQVPQSPSVPIFHVPRSRNAGMLWRRA